LFIAKYLDGMPLYRLERKLARYNLPLTRSTQASWMIQCGQLVQPLIKEGKSAQSQSHIWVQRGGPPESPVILYDYLCPEWV